MIDHSIDRYARGDLSAAEARDLAQASLDSPELFDELTDSALAKAAVDSRPRPTRRTTWFVIAGLAAAAAVFISIIIIRPWRTASAPLEPTLAIAGSHMQPVLLADGLQPPGQGTAPVFRSPAIDSRAPQLMGSIVSIEDGLASIDLGSLDGLEKGSELRFFRDDQSNEAIGRLQVTTVFREHARGRIIDGRSVRVKDRVRVDSAAHLDALLQQLDALYQRGDAEAAYQVAEAASRWVVNTNISSIRQSEFWNQLAVLRIVRGDYNGAEAPLRRAVAGLPTSALMFAQCMNNLGVLAEMRGDRRTSASRYADALRAVTGIPDLPGQVRRTIQANLARLQGRH